MNIYIFQREKFHELYNCDYLNETQWESYAVKRPVMGVICLLNGVIYTLTYISCLIIMSRDTFYKLSCYKIMFFLGVIDVVCIWVNCFTTGFFMIHGSMYCMYPNLQYIAGAIAIGGWSGQCMSCVFLALNRCIDFWSPYWSEILFEGKRTYLWIAAAWMYMLYFLFFTKVVVYTSAGIMWFFDPYLTVPQDLVPVDREQYRNLAHSLNDYTLVTVMFTLYSVLIIAIRIKSRGQEAMKSTQMKILIQALMICVLNFTPSVLFAFAQFIPTPEFFVFLLVLTWQAGNGGAGIILLIFNKTIRLRVKELVLRRPAAVGSISGTLARMSQTQVSQSRVI